MTGLSSRGFRLPPAWSAHKRTYMAWPCREALWGDALDTARRATAEIADRIAEFEPVTMIVRPELTAGVSLYCGPGISVLPLEQDDSWIRDVGPAFMTDGQGGLAATIWRFNGWGERFADYAQDEKLAGRLAERLKIETETSSLVLEGSAISVDGEGTCLLAARSVLDPARNPGITREAVEQELDARLGISRVIWLDEGLADDSYGELDSVAMFAAPGVVIAAVTDDQDDPDHAALQTNLDRLNSASDAAGRPLKIVPIKKPRRSRDLEGLPASYVSCHVANGAVIVPRFNDPADKAAHQALAQAFPGREIVPVDALEILRGGGGIRDITLEEPDPAARMG